MKPAWPYAFASSLLLLAPAAEARVLRCRPTVKYECSEQRCLRVTEGFQHAESFTWDDARRRLTVCLWARCYQGAAAVTRDANGAVTAFGSLSSEPAGGPPIYVSVTLGPDDKFTAVWEQRSDGLVFDVGRCDAGAAPAGKVAPPAKPHPDVSRPPTPASR
jgi:hypothetical protein